MIKEIIVVEGKSDTVAIRNAVQAETIETGGSAINNEIIERIRLARERRGVIIFTDPDHAGERLRKIISERVPGCKHAFLNREEALGKRNIGVENADPEAIRKALEQLKTEILDAEPQIGWDDLLAAGLINHPDAAARRMKMGKLLRIGYANGKQFYKRCHIFQISREEFMVAWKKLDEEGLL
ncbi:ribonuclease M5 [Ferviditalea candida]|uniref:Ribonuclease M5 n=1 Tax=Ferviditalea candida TaxID=3108399 RepID=A0ABU5ZIR9_9BACL|nr:ribonuclease M5 [Paenibacillaceae bacterium T2]